MFIAFDAERASDSPFIERVWNCHSERSGTFLSVASSHWELVVTRLADRMTITMRGPETRVRNVDCPAHGEWFAIRFKAGAFMPRLPVARLLNGNDLVLPQPSARTFWLDGAAWELPQFHNAEVFAERLASAGVIARDPAVAAALLGDPRGLSSRSMQRHFRQATGMTCATMRKIERARHATNLLRQGLSITDTVHEAGYFDQAHLTRSLKTLIGLTPANIQTHEHQLSFLYKTAPLR